jgi:hypothetical protein
VLESIRPDERGAWPVAHAPAPEPYRPACCGH